MKGFCIKKKKVKADNKTEGLARSWKPLSFNEAI
jgi:hypothetical protein